MKRVHGTLTSLRPATDDDVGRLVAWHDDPDVARYWDDEHFTEAEMRERLARRDVEAWIVEADDEPVGYLQVHSTGLDMFLISSARGRGLGPDASRAMTRHLLEERGWTRVTVDPYVWNEQAIRAWRKAGFTEVSSGHPPDDDHTAEWILMELRRQSASGSSSASPSVSSGSGAGDSSSSSFLSSSRGASIFCSDMKVVLPDQSELELPDGATGLDAARAIGPKLAEQAVLVRSNGRVQDVRLPLRDGEPIQFLTTRDVSDPDALYVLRHSSAHLLAEAVRRLFPGVKIAIGPPIENGFYYDFEFPEPIHEEDLERIEAEIAKLLQEGREWSRQEISRDEAKARFEAEHEPYKVQLVDTAEGAISLYTQGDFTDLCRGPHLQNSKPIKALKLTSIAGAYWRGDSSQQQLTRIYGTAFYRQEDLDAYLDQLEEARRRDHRVLGQQLDLFHLSDRSPGSPFWHPRGMVLWNELEDLRRRENLQRGYREVKTPLLYDVDTYITSGHYDNYRDNMFFVASHEDAEKQFALKPMNCPGHMLLFGSTLRSYRDLPLRYAESSTLHRDEPSGTLHGLLRVRHVTQDDAHIFCTRDQIEGEIFGCLDFAAALYDRFGMTARFELSTRPEHKVGTDEEWDFTEGALRAALERRGIDYELNEGDGAFYGPKIDLHMTDVLGRSWQMGTIQLDAIMPQRFGLTYMGPDNREHTPYVVHRALLGSLERFMGILIEHYGGAFPFWLAPVQIRVLPVGEGHLEAATALIEKLNGAGYRVDVGEPTETIAKRIREAELEKIPFIVVYGDRESDESLAIREHGGSQTQESLADFLVKLATLAA